jgi:hypothetical protein
VERDGKRGFIKGKMVVLLKEDLSKALLFVLIGRHGLVIGKHQIDS